MNIKDYLHLYLGCEVQYPSTIEGKIIKSTLTGFSRADGVETTYKRKKDGCVGDYLAWKENGSHSCNAFNIKLILRPLSDMTEEERHLTGLFNNLEHCKRWCKNNEAGKHPFLNAENMRFLLSKRFDLFGLIDAGLAIDKTTLK